MLEPVRHLVFFLHGPGYGSECEIDDAQWLLTIDSGGGVDVEVGNE